MPIIEGAPIQRYENGEMRDVQDALVREAHVAITLRGKELIRTTCSPGQLRQWAIGYLFSEGHIERTDDVEQIREADGVLSIGLVPSAPAEPAPPRPVKSDWSAPPQRILAIAHEVVERAEVFRRTGGTHAMAIASETDIVSHAEDISRTCALEKAIGLALERHADFARSIALLSSRVPSRMIVKLARCGIPIVAAVSAPTLDAVRRAEMLNVCLCGFVRDDRLNVYAYGRRIAL